MSFLIPFKGENHSGDIADNILYKEKNIYIMDNHRLALWCWCQEIDKNKSYNLFHIDAHPDMAQTACEIFPQKKINLWECSLENYQQAFQEEYNVPLFRWDNYLQILLKHYPNILKWENTYSATHKVGSSETLGNDISSYRLLSELTGLLSGKKFINENEWIINLDLDYFFSAQPEKVLMYSEEYLNELAKTFKMGLDSGLIKVLTIALSPECCGSWEKSKRVLSIFTKHIGMKEVVL